MSFLKNIFISPQSHKFYVKAYIIWKRNKVYVSENHSMIKYRTIKKKIIWLDSIDNKEYLKTNLKLLESRPGLEV